MTYELIRPSVRHHVMLDFETLSLNVDAVLPCAGIAFFDDDFNVLGKERYNFPLEAQNHRSISPDTLRWWTRQEGFRNVLGEEEPLEPLYTVVHMLLINIERAETVWTNGSKDPEWLASIALDTSREFMLPEYNKFREFRTIRELAREHGHVSVPIEHDYTRHDPVGDCLWQLAELKACFAHLGLSLNPHEEARQEI